MNQMNPKNVKYRKTLLGIVVTYDCPHCDSNLKSKIDEAGKDDHCPICEGAFVVPGTEYREYIKTQELQEMKEAEKERLAQENQRLARKKKAEEEERLRREREKQEAQIRREVDRQIEIQEKQQKEQSEDQMEPINYISLGLAHLAMMLWVNIQALCGYALIYGIGFNMFLNDRDVESLRISGVISFLLGIYQIGTNLYRAHAAYNAFMKGASPKRKISLK